MERNFYESIASSKEISASSRVYRVNKFTDNIFSGKMPKKFQQMFNSASGNELNEKACSIH